MADKLIKIVLSNSTIVGSIFLFILKWNLYPRIQRGFHPYFDKSEAVILRQPTTFQNKKYSSGRVSVATRLLLAIQYDKKRPDSNYTVIHLGLNQYEGLY